MYRFLAPVIGCLSLFNAPAAVSGELDGADIRQKIAGSRIFLKTPLGGEFPMNYRSNGRVDANGEAHGLGRFVRPSDEGRWWIRDDQLCQKWTSWYKGRTFCFTLIDRGGGKLVWKRDDGASGRARLGGKL